MQVVREQQAMQIVGRGRPRRQAEERGAEVLDALAILAAEIDVASRRQAIVERNELERRPEVGRPVGAILVAWNVIVDYEMIGRRSILNQTAGYKYWVLRYWGRRGKVSPAGAGDPERPSRASMMRSRSRPHGARTSRPLASPRATCS